MPTPPAGGELTVTVVRTIAAPVAEVFAAWTEPALLARWIVPVLCRVVEAEADPRPGGAFRLVMRGPLGGRHVITGEYREVVPNERLVQTWVLEGYGRDAGRYPTLLTVDFRALGPEATELTIRQDGFRSAADASGNRTGWRLCLRKLEKTLRRDRAGRG